MPDVLQVGFLMIRVNWLLIGISGVVGYFAMKHKFKKTDLAERPVLDKLFNALIIVFLVWKLSPLLSTPSMLWTMPFGLLVIPGNAAGGWLGIGLALLYMDRALRKMSVSRLFFADLLSLGFVTAMLVYHSLGWRHGSMTDLPWGIPIENPEFRYHPVNVYTLLVTLPIWIWLWKKSPQKFGTGVPISYVLLFYGMGLMLVSFFKMKVNVFYGLSWEQIFYLLIMVSGWILFVSLQKKKR